MIIDRNCVGLLPLAAALAATGIIWVRYSFVINPVNYSLAAVSAIVTCVGSDSALMDPLRGP